MYFVRSFSRLALVHDTDVAYSVCSVRWKFAVAPLGAVPAGPAWLAGLAALAAPPRNTYGRTASHVIHPPIDPRRCGADSSAAAQRAPNVGRRGAEGKKWDRGSGSSSAHTESAAPRSAQPRRAKTHKTFHSIKCYTRRPAPTPFQRQTRAPPRRRHGNGEGQFFMHPSASPRPSPRAQRAPNPSCSHPLAWPGRERRKPTNPLSRPAFQRLLEAKPGASDDTHSP